MTQGPSNLFYSKCYNLGSFIGWRRICGRDGDPAFLKIGCTTFSERPFHFDREEAVALDKVPDKVRVAHHRLFPDGRIRKDSGKKV